MNEEPNRERNIILVSSDGKINDIQTAIKMAKPNYIIQVTNGFYRAFTINKPGITIEAVNGHDNVVVLADKGDAIVVDCQSDNQITIRNLKVAHTVSKSEININRLINIFFKKKKILKSEKSDYHTTLAKDYTRNLTQVCLLRVVKGDVYVSGCFFSYKIMSKSLETVCPGVVLEKNTKVYLKNCEIIGHRIYQTTGVVNFKGSLTMEDCKIYCNLNGGVSILLGRLIRKK